MEEVGRQNEKTKKSKKKCRTFKMTFDIIKQIRKVMETTEGKKDNLKIFMASNVSTKIKCLNTTRICMTTILSNLQGLCFIIEANKY